MIFTRVCSDGEWDAFEDSARQLTKIDSLSQSVDNAFVLWLQSCEELQREASSGWLKDCGQLYLHERYLGATIEYAPNRLVRIFPAKIPITAAASPSDMETDESSLGWRIMVIPEVIVDQVAFVQLYETCFEKAVTNGGAAAQPNRRFAVAILYSRKLTTLKSLISILRSARPAS